MWYNMVAVQFESLQSEKEELTKTAESRLLEINQLTQHITELKQEMEKIKLASLQVRAVSNLDRTQFFSVRYLIVQ